MSVNMMAASLRCSLSALIGRGALSARRKNCPSFRFCGKESLDQFLEASLAAKRVEPLVGLRAAVVALEKDAALVEALLKQPQRLLVLTQGKVDDSERVGRHITLPGLTREVIEGLSRFSLFAQTCIDGGKPGRPVWGPISLHRFLI